MDSMMGKLVMGLVVVVAIFEAPGVVDAWTGEIRGRVVCDVCADSSIGPEDHVLEVCSSLCFRSFALCSKEI
ncbi:BnaA10g09150D [Brassica napus]|uniref:BnaA10g09150D protein n=1 Tax=Brassica napus TaxID=3708 RepID=A0A078FWF8_BRANA|nr:BnaA10g09150D [Brassica napus]